MERLVGKSFFRNPPLDAPQKVEIPLSTSTNKRKLSSLTAEKEEEQRMEKYGHGKNHLVLGCMFGSKTTHLQEIVERTRRCPSILTLVLAPCKDVRWGTSNEIKSHAGQKLEADARVGSGKGAIEYVLRRCREDLESRP